MALANLVTEFRASRYSDSVMPTTIADAIGDSKRQFTKCYRTVTIGAMTQAPKYPSTPSVDILKKMVADCGGPAKFARTYSRDDAESPIDPTFVSQIINGHRPFRDQARLNMARRAGLADDHFEKFGHETTNQRAEEKASVYSFQMSATDEVLKIMIELDSDRQQQLIGAAKHLLNEQRLTAQNSTKRAGQ